MAYITGNASGLDDLFDTIIGFATDHTWTILEDFRNTAGKLHTILKGVGLSGNDEIYIGVQKYLNALFGVYGLRLQGFTGYQEGVAFDSQAGAIPHNPGANRYSPTIPLWNDSMKYWITGNGRHLKFAAKISAVYEAGYAGFGKMYGTPKQFPYPLIIGGSAVDQQKYDQAGAIHSHFAIPYAGTTDTSLRLRDTAGIWRAFSIHDNMQGYTVFPYQEYSSRSGKQGWTNLIATPNAGDPGNPIFPVQPVLLVHQTTNEGVDVFGELDGVYHIGGLNNAVENILHIGSDQYLVLQNVARNTPQNYWGMKLA